MYDTSFLRFDRPPITPLNEHVVIRVKGSVIITIVKY